MSEPSESAANVTFDEVVKTKEDVERLLNDKPVKRSDFRVYAELEHILHGMIAQKTFIDLIEFMQNGAIRHAVYIGGYGLPATAGGVVVRGKDYWILYGDDKNHDDGTFEIKKLREVTSSPP